MALVCIKRGMAIQVYLNEENYYIFQKLKSENNVTIYEQVDPITNVKHVRKRHAPLRCGVECVRYGPMGFDDEYDILGKTVSIDNFKWYIKKSIKIVALPYIKQYENNSDDAHKQRIKGVNGVVEKIWRQPASR